METNIGDDGIELIRCGEIIIAGLLPEIEGFPFAGFESKVATANSKLLSERQSLRCLNHLYVF
jgi:hypothetical protein